MVNRSLQNLHHTKLESTSPRKEEEKYHSKTKLQYTKQKTLHK